MLAEVTPEYERRREQRRPEAQSNPSAKTARATTADDAIGVMTACNLMHDGDVASRIGARR